MDQAIPLLTTALACEGPRVFTLSLPPPMQQETPYSRHLSFDNAHKIVSAIAGAKTRATMEAYTVFVAKQVAKLAQSLSVHKGRDGLCLLDNTLIVWISKEGQQSTWVTLPRVPELPI